MDKKEIKFNVPGNLYKRIDNVSKVLGYSGADEYIGYIFSLTLQAFDTPEE
jgi:metal-responsive CopG/Arc/MetJ family transcriptional regulator